MQGKSCKLYDESLVHAIMVSTGLAIVDYIKQFKSVNAAEIYDFVEQNAEHIIHNTIDTMNQASSDEAESALPSPDDEDPPLF